MSTNAWALTTRQRVMDFMGISSLTTTQENVMDRIIDSVTDFIENYCGRRFKRTTYEETYNGHGAETIVLNQYPVSSTDSFTLSYRNSSANEDSWTAFDSEDYFVDYSSGVVTLSGNARFMKFSYSMYKVNYSAGYNFDNITTFLSTLGASDLEYITWKLCTTAFNKKQSEVGIESESIGDYSVTYSKELFENKEVAEIIGKYAKADASGLSSPKNY